VRYQFEGGALVRSELRQGQPVRRDSYTVPKRVEPFFDVFSRRGISWVRLSWKPAEKSTDGRRVATVPIEAAVNRFGPLDRKGANADDK
jgi:hypothetical protein